MYELWSIRLNNMIVTPIFLNCITVNWRTSTLYQLSLVIVKWLHIKLLMYLNTYRLMLFVIHHNHTDFISSWTKLFVIHHIEFVSSWTKLLNLGGETLLTLVTVTLAKCWVNLLTTTTTSPVVVVVVGVVVVVVVVL